MSEQEKKKRLLNIVKYFGSGTKKVSDLKELLESTSTSGDKNDDEDTQEKSWRNVDALVVLTCNALSDSELLNRYLSYKGITTPNRAIITAYQRIRPAEGNQYGEIKDEWTKQIASKIQLDTKLTKVLDYIKKFADSQSTTVYDFKVFLTKIQNGVSAEDILGIKDETKDAMEIITKAIENAAQKDAIKKCVIFTGAPGTGKTYCVEEYVKKHTDQDKNRWEFVQFHSSYDYTDFVEGLRPIKERKEMVFVRMDGIFKAFCRKVVKLNKAEQGTPKSDEKASDKKTYYYFVIDEINRADLGRVFGELMYCFEKRGEEHKIAMQYANLPAYNKTGKRIYDDCFRDGFYIPGNVVIIGTMNDIDRSVETFDFALRRRFDWVEIEADEVMESSLVSMGVPTDIVGRIKEMNKIIEDKSGLGKDFKIGPAYFQKYDGSNLKDIWEHNIEPILKEYMRGRQGPKDFIDKCEAALFSKDANA